ncbi:MAG TPA: GAF domain-containing sensor histidine kinase, partial [Chloroflexota bacterium]|nr:GAF domain-containing sensor histidine kinase [Chloroflexota bacterium]
MTEHVPAKTHDADAWQIAASLVTATTLQERLELLLQAAPRVAGADTATLFLRQDTFGPLEAVARIGYGSDVFGPPRKGGLTEQVLTTGQALVVDDTNSDPRINPLVRTAGVRSFIALPLLIRYATRADASSPPVEQGQAPSEDGPHLEPMGVLYVNASRPHAFSAETVSILAGLAALASVTIENGLLLESHRAALASLSESLHVREQFVSLVSHELKGPLTPLKGYAQAIVRRLDRAVSAGQAVDESWLRRSLGIMVTQIDRLDRLVTDLLDVSRVRAGRFTISPKPLDMVSFAREVFERFQDTIHQDPTTAGAKHTFHWSPATDSLPGVWDPDRLEQLITNLLSNAVKY